MAEKPSIRVRIFKLGSRMARTRVKPGTESRVRLLLLIGALLALYLAFANSQDWFVAEFATYDWARDLGF